MKEYLSLAWENLSHRKKRAWLTIIGIFIGIMAVIALVSLGQGLKKGVNEEFEKLGVDKVFVQPANLFGNAPTPLTEDDLDRVRGVRGVAEATGVQYGSGKVEWGDEINFPYIVSSPSDDTERALLSQTWQLEVVAGRELESQDQFKAVVGFDYTRRELFQDTIQVGDRITVNNATFTVVGIRKRIGNAMDDQQVIIPEDTYNELFAGEVEYDMLIIRAASGNGNDIAKPVERALQSERDVKPGDEDFSVSTAEDIQQSVEQVLGIIQIVLTGVAAISLLVGTVGITNTMYTAVLERTKEIGIMKAVGATNNAILSIFLFESAMLGLIGGIVGVVLGLAISFGVAAAAQHALGTSIIQAYVSWWLILGGLLFGTVIGSLAGYLPARQAAHMKPVDSLRYE
jgi:putative ABC transport system permease protein